MKKHEWQKGEIKDFPVEIIAKMLERQKEQGYGEDPTVFQQCKVSGSGFSWSRSPEKRTFWSRVIEYEDFKEFYKLYPKTPIYELWK